MTMSAEKREEMRFNAWCRAHEDTLLKAMNNPEKWELCKRILKAHDREEKIIAMLQALRPVQQEVAEIFLETLIVSKKCG